MTKEIKVGNLYQVMPHEGCPAHENGFHIRIERVLDDWIYYIPIADVRLRFLDEEFYSEDPEKNKARIDSLFAKKMLRDLNPEELEKINEVLMQAKTRKPLTFSKKCGDMLHNMQQSNVIAKKLLSKNGVAQDEGDYISLDKEGFRFVPFGKELKTEGGAWTTGNTQVIKFGRFAKRFLVAADNIPEQEYESFTNMVKAFIGVNGDEKGEGKYQFDIVEGEELRATYLENNYTREQVQANNLYSSCMRYPNCQPFLDIYVKNPSVVKMLVLRDYDGRVAGRALLWVWGESTIAMDRIYGTDAIMVMFKNHAKEKGWYYKSQQSNDSMFDMLGTRKLSQYPVFHVPVNIEGIKTFPYLDTLRYLDVKKSMLTTKEPHTKYFLLRNTSGRYDVRNDYTVWVDFMTGASHRSDLEASANVNYTLPDGTVRRGTTRANSLMYVTTPEGRDIHAHINDVVFSEYEGTYFLKGDPRLVEVDGYLRLA